MHISALRPFRPVISASLVCLAAAVVLSSCSKKPQQELIGKWNVAGQPTTVEFRKDGTVITTDNGKPNPAKYTFLNDSNLEMEMPTRVGTNDIVVRMKFAYSVHGDEADLSITVNPNPGEPPTTQTRHLKRAK